MGQWSICKRFRIHCDYTLSPLDLRLDGLFYGAGAIMDKFISRAVLVP